jgi:hypothetical protein
LKNWVSSAFLPFLLFGFFSPEKSCALTSENTAYRSIEQDLADSFEAGNCTRVTELFHTIDRKHLSPLAEAVAGFCEPDFKFAKEILDEASARDVSDDLIAYLHAKKVWLHARPESMDFWQRALLLARRPSLKNQIQNYLTGQDETFEEAPTIGHKSIEASVAMSGYREDNPYFFGESDQTRDPTLGVETDSEINSTHSASFGNWRAHATLKTQTYFTKHDVDFQGLDLDIPLDVKVGNNEDIIFTVLGGYSEQGGNSLQSYYGLSVQGVAYHPSYKQSVTATVYSDNLYPSLISAQGGFHARFDYAWEWFSGYTTFRISPYVEHVTSDSDLNTDITAPALIPYTYTAVGANVSVDQYVGRFTFALDLFSALRFDDDASVYTVYPQNTVTKTRADQSLISRLSVSYALQRNLQLVGWYEWNRTWSNIGPTDYQDRNFVDQIYAAGLRYSFATF